MQKILKALAISALLLAPASIADAQVQFGIRIGEPPAPRYYRVPARPGPNYEWVEGYWYPVRGRYMWRDGYWARPPRAGAYWVSPYYYGGQYYSGHWDGGNRNRRNNYNRNDYRYRR